MWLVAQSGAARACLRGTSALSTTSATTLAITRSPFRREMALLASSQPSSSSCPLARPRLEKSTSLTAARTSSLHTTHVAQATQLLRKPQEPEEPEVFRDGEPTIIATDRAVSQLKKVAERENNPSLALRVAVEPGGCHGYQYKMEITEEVEDDDFQFEVHPGVSILVDSVSLALVRGSTIDYVTELIGSQFAIKNNPQAKGAGCGCGVSWEPAI